MSSNLGSLLALDALASEKSIRVAAYARALRTHRRMETEVDTVAAAFVDFIAGQSWRLEALDAALEVRSNSLEGALARAAAVVRWVTQEPELVVVAAVEEPTPPTPAAPVTTRKKKVTRRTN